MLQTGTKLAFETPNDWRELIDSTESRSEIITLLIKLLDFVGDQSSFLCLTLAALTLESPATPKEHSVVRSVLQFSAHGADGQSLFLLVQDILEKAASPEL